jgi:AcrR family transcriptional regulator
MTDRAALLDSVADAAVSLAAERPWDEVALRDIAAAAELPMAALYGVVASKDDVLDAVAARLDREAADDLEIDRDAPVRERLFDAAMARFDAMEARRAGLVSILKAEAAKPAAAARALPRGLRTARWLMELAGVDSSGPMGLARAGGVVLILGRTTQAWLEEEAGGLAKTMAALDRALRDLETWRERFSPARGSKAPSEDAAPEASVAPRDESA